MELPEFEPLVLAYKKNLSVEQLFLWIKICQILKEQNFAFSVNDSYCFQDEISSDIWHKVITQTSEGLWRTIYITPGKIGIDFICSINGLVSSTIEEFNSEEEFLNIWNLILNEDLMHYVLSPIDFDSVNNNTKKSLEESLKSQGFEWGINRSYCFHNSRKKQIWTKKLMSYYGGFLIDINITTNQIGLDINYDHDLGGNQEVIVRDFFNEKEFIEAWHSLAKYIADY